MRTFYPSSICINDLLVFLWTLRGDCAVWNALQHRNFVCFFDSFNQWGQTQGQRDFTYALTPAMITATERLHGMTRMVVVTAPQARRMMKMMIERQNGENENGSKFVCKKALRQMQRERGNWLSILWGRWLQCLWRSMPILRRNGNDGLSRL